MSASDASGQTSFSKLESKLGKHFVRLKRFFFEAFKHADRTLSDENTFVVFIARRCFILACLFLRAFWAETSFFSKKVELYTDGGLKILAKRIARNLLIDENYVCRILLYDDILIHGRAIGGLLSSAEDIFVTEYLTLKKWNHGRGRDYTPAQLHDIFLSYISIEVAYINTQPDLLRERYRSRISNISGNSVQPYIWREASYRIARLIFSSEIPNAAFVPGILMNGASESLGRNVIQKHFEQRSHSYELADWTRISNSYNGRDMDCYLVTLPSCSEVRSVLTIRCTDAYIMPFVFLPMVRNEKFFRLENLVRTRLMTRSFDQTALDRLSTVLRGFRRIEKLSNMYAEFITTVLSVTLLRAFLDAIGLEFDPGNEQIEACVRFFTTQPLVMCNYAHEEPVEKLLFYLLRPDVKPLFSLVELAELMSDDSISDRTLLRHTSNITTASLAPEDRDKMVEIIGDVVFRYGAESEKEAYRLSTGYFAPSYEAVEYFYFPLSNNLESVIQKIYDDKNARTKDWMKKHVSIRETFAFILQLMDYGCFVLTTGIDENQNYTQCLKAGEQSLNEHATGFALSLPILREIEMRCELQNRQDKDAFKDELDYFVYYSYFKFRQNRLEDPLLNRAYLTVIRQRKRIAEFEDSLYDSGNSSRDYYFAVKEELDKENQNLSFSSYVDKCRELYFKTIY